VIDTTGRDLCPPEPWPWPLLRKPAAPDDGNGPMEGVKTMMYHGYGMGAGWSLILFAVALPALLLAIGLVVAQIQRAPHAPEPDAERVLADRLARGEIEPEEYEQRLHTLHAGRW
jgi:putative membrane protein